MIFISVFRQSSISQHQGSQAVCVQLQRECLRAKVYKRLEDFTGTADRGIPAPPHPLSTPPILQDFRDPKWCRFPKIQLPGKQSSTTQPETLNPKPRYRELKVELEAEEVFQEQRAGTLNPKPYMVVSLNTRKPNIDSKYYSPCYGGPQNGTPNFGKPPHNPFVVVSTLFSNPYRAPYRTPIYYSSLHTKP